MHLRCRLQWGIWSARCVYINTYWQNWNRACGLGLPPHVFRFFCCEIAWFVQWVLIKTRVHPTCTDRVFVVNNTRGRSENAEFVLIAMFLYVFVYLQGVRMLGSNHHDTNPSNRNFLGSN